MAQKRTRRRRLWLKIILVLFLLVFVLLGSSVAIITFWPDVAAKNIDRLRDVIGDAPVAQLEAITLSIQDRIQQLQYQAGLSQPAAPWGSATADATLAMVVQPTTQTLHDRAQLEPDQTEATKSGFTNTLTPASATINTIKQPTSAQ